MIAVLLAAGLTHSPSTPLPSALAILDGVPVVAVAVAEMRAATVLRAVQLLVVAPVGATADVRSALHEHNLMAGVSIVEGGVTLDESLHNALLCLPELPHVPEVRDAADLLRDDVGAELDCTPSSTEAVLDFRGEDDPVVVVHDASRPLASPSLIERVVVACLANSGMPVVPILPMTETVKRVDHSGRIVATIPRESVVRVQMPQASSLSRLRQAHAECVPDPRERVFLVGVGEDTEFVSGDELAMPVITAKDREMASVLRKRRALRPVEPSAD